MKFSIIFLLILCYGLLFSEFYTIPTDFPNIQAGIDYAENGDTIYVLNDTYNETLEIINKSVHIIGQSMDSCIIQAPGSDYQNSIIYANSWSSNLITIENVTVKKGHIGISANNCPECNLQLSNVRATDNNIGICANSANIDIYSCTINANRYNGLHITDSNSNIIDTNIINNNPNHLYELMDSGGGLYSVCNIGNAIYFSGVNISGNYARQTGGGIHSVNLSNFTFDSENLSTIQNNTAQLGHGDELFATGVGVSPNLLDSVFVFLTNQIPDTESELYPLGYWVINPTQQTGIDEFEISQNVISLSNFPNPFNPSTEFDFSVPYSAQVSLKIYNIKGQLIEVIFNKECDAGEYSYVWDSTDEQGSRLQSGIYIYQLTLNDQIVSINKCTILK